MGTVTSIASGNWNTGSTWDSGARPGSSDDVIIANGHNVTLVQDENANSLKSESGSTIVGGGFTITIDGQALGSAANLDGAVDAGSALNLTITTAAATVLDVYPSSGKITNLTINHASCVATLGAFTPMLGNLTITAGELNTDASNNYALTVTGDVSVVGTLTCNSSTVQCRGVDVSGSGTLTAPDASGSLTITGTQTGSSGNDAFDTESGTTFTHSSGTITFTGNTNPQIRNRSGESFNNIVINTTGGTPIVETQRDIAIAGNLTIVEGTFRSYGTNARTITVTGNVSVEDGGTLGGGSANTANHSFGSLTIASGGTYSATSGTTIVNGDPSGYPNLGINLDGTFTHNNGTLKYTGGSGGLDLACTGNLYNFEHAPTGTTFITNNTTIENNLTMTGANFQGVNGNENLTVKGNVTINSSGQTMNFNGSSEHTFGILTILDGT